ncbi:hypothetical protein JQS43_00885 [Natronosporangium hydrolyticum]|uniref:Uncharacterized protein n=1 Tax=Natronosporangium hydrolyticum TaxID=2811111 RepID=A0A895YC05_9ACTN|nr:hypothetical protein [Natronosporangium hydrolyticum]QSB14981.1 hypothetical protein JQS43_00885 [Natronosporangium hydrolyticum]
MTMRYALLVGVVTAALTGGALAGYGALNNPESQAQAQAHPGDEVVTSTGLPGIEVGAPRVDLVRTQGLAQGPGDCAPRLPEQPAASPVFDDDELVLLWANPPLHTADGVAVGSPVDDVTASYPDAEVLTAPAETYQFDGLLVPVDDHAYLFLHDGEHVQKLIVGSQEHARQLFSNGFGTC